MSHARQNGSAAFPGPRTAASARLRSRALAAARRDDASVDMALVGEPANKPTVIPACQLASTSKIGRKALRLPVSNRPAVLTIHAWPSS
jgi:hypothetical protein